MQLVNQNADAEITKCATYNESNAQLLLQKWEALENCVVRGHNGWWKWLNKSKKSALCNSDRWILIRYLLLFLSKTFKTEINDLANLIILSHGCVVGWFSPALPTLLSDDTPLITGPMSNEEISWISSMSSIGALVGTFIFGFMASQIGPKRSMSFLAFPPITYWILVRFGNTFYYLLAARFITGWTLGGIQSVIALYVSEISNDK